MAASGRLSPRAARLHAAPYAGPATGGPGTTGARTRSGVDERICAARTRSISGRKGQLDAQPPWSGTGSLRAPCRFSGIADVFTKVGVESMILLVTMPRTLTEV